MWQVHLTRGTAGLGGRYGRRNGKHARVDSSADSYVSSSFLTRGKESLPKMPTDSRPWALAFMDQISRVSAGISRGFRRHRPVAARPRVDEACGQPTPGSPRSSLSAARVSAPCGPSTGKSSGSSRRCVLAAATSRPATTACPRRYPSRTICTTAGAAWNSEAEREGWGRLANVRSERFAMLRPVSADADQDRRG